MQDPAIQMPQRSAISPNPADIHEKPADRLCLGYLAAADIDSVHPVLGEDLSRD
jgi:hypothetical protein